MAQKQNTSLYSKLKTFCEIHRIPFIVFPIGIGVVVAAIVLCIGGTIAGWHIARALVSNTAILVYAVLILVVLSLGIVWFTTKNRR